MKTLTINNFKIEIYSGFDGDQVFISKGGEDVYSARTCKGQGLQRALDIISR